MENKNKKQKISLLRLSSASIMIIAAALVIYIMSHNLGLADSLDFGAGAYYYADMPGFEQWTDKIYYVSETPMWFLILLFLIWGFFMYRLWLLLDKKNINL